MKHFMTKITPGKLYQQIVKNIIISTNTKFSSYLKQSNWNENKMFFIIKK